MLEEFLAWWLTQCRDLLPRSWRDSGAARAPYLTIVPDRIEQATSLGVFLVEAGAEQPLGHIQPDPGAGKSLAGLLGNRTRPSILALRVPAGSVLGRDVTLPLAAERELASVLGYEMDRLTPFTADELFFSHEIVGRDRAASRITLRLALTPRAQLEPLITQLALAGLSPDAIEGREADGSVRRITLAGRSRGADANRRAIRAGWALAACLAIACLVIPFLRQGAALAASEATVTSLRPRVAAVDRLRARLDASTAGTDVLAAAERDIGDPLDVLATLTQLLPDDTFLTDLSLTGRKLTINGQSASAAKLIGLLSTDPSLANPSFVAPVTRLETTHTDLFSIRADIVR